jgi:hypothetical protein
MTCRYWFDSNPCRTEKIHTDKQKVTVETGIIDHNIIGTFFTNEILTSAK